MDLLKEQLLKAYNKAYSPDVNAITDEKLSELSEADPQLLAFLKELNKKREEDPFIGSKIAGEEIYLNLIEMLKNEKGVHAETLLAVLGTLGGQECLNGVMTALSLCISDDSVDKNKTKSVAGLLDIFIAETKSGETFVLGDRIGNTFLSFYYTAANDNSINIDNLIALSAKVASQIGTDDYWKTSFDEYIPESPKELLKLFDGKFEQSLKRYCFSPQERLIAFAVAAQKVVKQAEVIMDKQRALDIISDYGWRTSHFDLV